MTGSLYRHDATEEKPCLRCIRKSSMCSRGSKTPNCGPPAIIITAECDPLRDEGQAYAKRLEYDGVPVTYTCYAGMIHPFFSLSGAIPQAFDAIQQVANAVANSLSLAPSPGR